MGIGHLEVRSDIVLPRHALSPHPLPAAMLSPVSTRQDTLQVAILAQRDHHFQVGLGVFSSPFAQLFGVYDGPALVAILPL